MRTNGQTQQERALFLLTRGHVALLRTRPRGDPREGLILQLSRGLYQLPGADDDANHAIVQAPKLVPKGVVCLVSELAFHQLTDTILRSVWMAIGPKDTASLSSQVPRFRSCVFATRCFTRASKSTASGPHGALFNVPKTVVDLFRYRQSAGKRYKNSASLNLALEGLREALRQNKTTSAEIAEYARDAGIWKVVEP